LAARTRKLETAYFRLPNWDFCFLHYTCLVTEVTKQVYYSKGTGMRVEYINPFIEATLSILRELLLDIEIKRGNIYLRASTVLIKGVAVLVGLAGDVEGRVLLDMNQKTALNVAGVMNGGEEFTVMDDMVKSTIQELGNLITARAVTQLGTMGYRFDLTPPVLFTGDQMEISNNLKLEAIIVPLELGSYGTIEVNIAVRERM
jgi:chemotaxis protein CheX